MHYGSSVAAADLPKQLTEARVDLAARIDADDIVKGLNNNDEEILTFICQMLALAGSSDLRDRLKERFESWDDEDWK